MESSISKSAFEENPKKNRFSTLPTAPSRKSAYSPFKPISVPFFKVKLPVEDPSGPSTSSPWSESPPAT